MITTQSDRSHRIEEAVLRAVAYGDVFDSPMRLSEIRRYLEGVPADRGEVERAVEALVPDRLSTIDGLICIAGRERLVAVRREREATAQRLWPAAQTCGRSVARLPWVRMVSLTGALAMDNVEKDDDVDLLIVTEPGRVWLCRFFVVQMVRRLRMRGIEMCPNWLLSTQRLELEARDLHTARELTQMVPLAGMDVYRRMRELNRWTDAVLPNSAGPPRDVPCSLIGGSVFQRASEAMLGSGLGTTLESWMARRKIREIRRIGGENPEVVLDHHQCKGHVDGHGQRIADTYAARLRSLSLDDDSP